jgi:hypothetical protein
MFSYGKIGFMESILEGEKHNFKDYFDPTSLKKDEGYMENGNVLFKIDPNTDSMNQLMTKYKVITKREKLIGGRYPEYHTYEQIENDVTKEIHTLKKLGNLSKCMQTAKNIENTLGKNFYGCLLIHGGQIVNPLHPVVAMSILEDNNLYMNKDSIFDLVVFTYSNRADMDYIYKTEKADKDLIEKNINALITAHSRKFKSKTKLEGIESNGNGLDIKIKYRNSISSFDKDGYEYLIVAHQMLTTGTVFPFYGTSILKTSKSLGTSGFGLSPLKSCNIDSSSSYHDGTEFDSPYQIKNGLPLRVMYHSVCTGSENERTLKGMRTLTHSNANSPYNINVFEDGALEYVEACNKKSFEMYMITKVIQDEREPYSKEEMNATTVKELLKLNHDLTIDEATEKLVEINEYKKSKQAKIDEKNRIAEEKARIKEEEEKRIAEEEAKKKKLEEIEKRKKRVLESKQKREEAAAREAENSEQNTTEQGETIS